MDVCACVCVFLCVHMCWLSETKFDLSSLIESRKCEIWQRPLKRTVCTTYIMHMISTANLHFLDPEGYREVGPYVKKQL